MIKFWKEKVKMNSSYIQDAIYQWALSNGFDAPYGVLTGEWEGSNGKKYKSVTFGRAGTLDANVIIYNKTFILLKTSQSPYTTQVFKTYEELQKALAEL
jgi:hypothetical protein